MADGGFVCPYKYLLDVHSELCPGSMQHLQHVHNFVRPGLQYLLDMQLVSVRMLDLLKLFGRARRDSGILSGNSGTTLFDLLGERHNSADNLCGTNADSKGTNTRGTFHTGERWPRHATAKLAE